MVELLCQGVYLEWTSPCIIYMHICRYTAARSQGGGGCRVLACFDILEIPLHPSDLGEICHWTKNLGSCRCAGRIMSTKGKKSGKYKYTYMYAQRMITCFF